MTSDKQIKPNINFRDRGDNTFQNHINVAQQTGATVDWLEEQLRAEVILGFELDDGVWITTVQGVKKFLASL